MAEFEVESFEHVAATPGTVLLRLSGRWRSADREQLAPPILIVIKDDQARRLPPLPGPDDAAPLTGPDGPGWRAAYSAPADVVRDGRVRFALDAGQGVAAELPRPTEGRRAVADGRREEGVPGGELPAAPSGPVPVEADKDVAAVRAQLADARARLRRVDALVEEVERAGAAAGREASEHVAALEAELRAAQDAGAEPRAKDVEAALADARLHVRHLEATAAQARELARRRDEEAAAEIARLEARLGEKTTPAHGRAERGPSEQPGSARAPLPSRPVRPRRRVTALPRRRPPRRRAESRYLPSERTVGLLLLLVGAAAAAILVLGFLRAVALDGG